MKMKGIFLLLLVASMPGYAESAGTAQSNREYNDPLKVKGSTRKLNMMLNLKSDAEIKFVRLRKNYRQEILATQY